MAVRIFAFSLKRATILYRSFDCRAGKLGNSRIEPAFTAIFQIIFLAITNVFAYELCHELLLFYASDYFATYIENAK